MQLGMIGLGKMGANMCRRLRQAGVDVVGYAPHAGAAEALAQETGLRAAKSLDELSSLLTPPRKIWVMVPAGAPTEAVISELATKCTLGDLLIDGGNSNYRDSIRHAKQLAASGILFADVGTSGGVWGLKNGYCLMAGGSVDALSGLTPILQALAPAPDRGWLHVGPSGAGHFVKMVHNGIEYGMMQALAEGLNLMRAKTEFNFDLSKITELWRHGSVVQSWLLDLTAGALQTDQQWEAVSERVADSGEGRWTAIEAIELGVAIPVILQALQVRFQSQDQQHYSEKLLSLMRNAFGGHVSAKNKESK